MAVPLAFVAFDAGSEERAPHHDSLALLEAVRRNAGRVSLFCQAGRIAVPARYRSLLTYLERSVVEVTPPRPEFVFHPKVWLVRYAGADDAVTYRLLCLTRNLTFDRSWDTVLTLEGPLARRTNAFAVNHPLGDFVAALPGWRCARCPSGCDATSSSSPPRCGGSPSSRPPTSRATASSPWDSMPARAGAFPGGNSKGLVVSPFLAAETLQHLPDCPGGLTLVSRLEALSDLSAPVLARFTACYTLSEMAEPEPGDDESTPAEGQQPRCRQDRPRGDAPERPSRQAVRLRSGPQRPPVERLAQCHLACLPRQRRVPGGAARLACPVRRRQVARRGRQGRTGGLTRGVPAARSSSTQRRGRRARPPARRGPHRGRLTASAPGCDCGRRRPGHLACAPPLSRQ